MIFRTQAPSDWKARLEKTGTSDGGWTIHYFDPQTGEKWIEYFPYFEDRSPSYFRREKIPADPEELLRICFHSDCKEDWQGVAAHCSGAFDTEVIAKILSAIAINTPKERLIEFGKYFIPRDNRDLLGMHINEITESYNRYKDACDQISAIVK